MRTLIEGTDRKVGVLDETGEKLFELSQIQRYAFSLEMAAEQKDDNTPKPTTPPSRIVACDESDQIVAGLELAMEDIYLKGRPIGHGGLGGVCSLPYARRKGYVGSTLQGTLIYLRELGKPTSALYPFKFEFYRQFGWELAQKDYVYTIPMTELKKFAKAPGKMVKVSKGTDENPDPTYNRLTGLYAGWAPKYGGSFVRSAEWWRNRKLSELGAKRFAFIHVGEEGADDGYIIYTMNRNNGNSELLVNEMYWRSPSALRGILSFAYSHDSMLRNLTFSVPMNVDLLNYLDNPRVEVRARAGMMFRVVDVQAVLTHLSLDYTGVPLTLSVEDKDAQWNNGIFKVEAGGRVKGPINCDNPPVDAAFTIQRLSQAACGYCSATNLFEAGLIRGEKRALPYLDSLFGCTGSYTSFLNDAF